MLFFNNFCVELKNDKIVLRTQSQPRAIDPKFVISEGNPFFPYSDFTSHFINILLRQVFSPFFERAQPAQRALKDAQLRDYTKIEMKVDLKCGT